MIYAVCGTPGSYKSCYTCEKFLLPALKSGRHVYTNIEGLNPLYIASLFDLDPIDVDQHLHILGQVYDDSGIPHEERDLIRRFYEDLPINALVIIDEAQNYFSSRDFKEGFSADLIPWITKHRHLGNDVVWITQNLDSVDITFRRNTHLTHFLRRAENIGFKNAAFDYIFDRADTERRHLARKVYRPDPNIFKIYSSYQAENVVEKRNSYNVFLRSPFVWLMIIAFAWAGYVIFSGSFSRQIMHKGKTEKKTEQVAAKPVQKIEQKDEEKDVVPEKQSRFSLEDNCIMRTSKIRGELTFYFKDGTVGTSTNGLDLCR